MIIGRILQRVDHCLLVGNSLESPGGGGGGNSALDLPGCVSMKVMDMDGSVFGS